MELLFFILILFVVCFYIWFFPFNRRSQTHISIIAEPATFSLIILCVTAWIGVITIYFLREGHYFNKVVFNYTKNDGLILIFVTAAVFLMSYVSKVNVRFLRKVHLYSQSKIDGVDWLIIIIISLIFSYYLYVDGHFILGMFQAKNQYAIMALRKASTSAGSDYLFKKVVLEGVFWVSLLYYYSVSNRTKSFTTFLYIVTFIFSLFLLISLKKISLVMLYLSIYLVVNYNSKFSFVKLFKLILYFILFMFFVYFLLIKNVDLEYMLSPFREGLIGRIFISEVSSLYAHMEIFQNNHLGLESLSRSFSKLLGIGFSPRSGEIVMATVNPSWVEMGIGGTYNTLFLGEAFANFSYYGLVFSILYVPLFYLFIVRSIVIFPVKFRVPFLIYLSLNVNIMSGFNDFIYDPFLVLIYFVFMLRAFLVKKR
ncbi:hypothetical protein ACRRS0_21455 [Agarivorans sp. QJM3NY_29]|uniref:hypothetical protein n=1 Tax=unclassified Agarivorans TaxID=2636026 RepID=UPI003D7E1334